MGGCVSLCKNRNEDDITNNAGNYPRTNIEDIKSPSMESSQGSMRRTKKNKTRMPSDFVFKDDDDEDLINPPVKGSKLLDFERICLLKSKKFI